MHETTTRAISLLRELDPKLDFRLEEEESFSAIHLPGAPHGEYRFVLYVHDRARRAESVMNTIRRTATQLRSAAQRIGVNRRGIAPPDSAEPQKVDAGTVQPRFEPRYSTSVFNALLCGWRPSWRVRETQCARVERAA